MLYSYWLTTQQQPKTSFNTIFSPLQMGRIKKDQFIRFLRNYVGDKVLTTVAKKLRGC